MYMVLIGFMDSKDTTRHLFIEVNYSIEINTIHVLTFFAVYTINHLSGF